VNLEDGSDWPRECSKRAKTPVRTELEKLALASPGNGSEFGVMNTGKTVLVLGIRQKDDVSSLDGKCLETHN